MHIIISIQTTFEFFTDVTSACMHVRGEKSAKAGNGVPHSKFKPRLCTSELAVQVSKNGATVSD